MLPRCQSGQRPRQKRPKSAEPALWPVRVVRPPVVEAQDQLQSVALSMAVSRVPTCLRRWPRAVARQPGRQPTTQRTSRRHDPRRGASSWACCRFRPVAGAEPVNLACECLGTTPAIVPCTARTGAEAGTRRPARFARYRVQVHTLWTAPVWREEPSPARPCNGSGTTACTLHHVKSFGR
jgi:hypothetical protein